MWYTTAMLDFTFEFFSKAGKKGQKILRDKLGEEGYRKQKSEATKNRQNGKKTSARVG